MLQITYNWFKGVSSNNSFTSFWQFSALLGHAAGSTASVAGTYSHLFSSAAAASVGADSKTPVPAMPIFWYNNNRNDVALSEDNINDSADAEETPDKHIWIWYESILKPIKSFLNIFCVNLKNWSS